MATGSQNITTAASHIDEIWVDGVIRAREFKIVVAPRVDRTWDYVGHGDVYHKARLPNIESQSKSASTDLNATVYTDTEQTITVNNHIACAIKHEDIAQLLSKNDVKMEMQKKMGYSLARKVDVDLCGLAASFSQIVGTLGVELTYDNLLAAVQYLEEAGVDMGEDVCWVISPAQKAGIMKMDTFINAQYVGEDNARAAHESARIGSFQGAPIVISNLVTSPAAGQHESFLFEKSVVALVMAQDPKTTTERLALGLSDVVVQDEIYGYSEVTTYSEAPGNITATDTGACLLRGT